MPERFGSNESTYDSLRVNTLARAGTNYSHDHDDLYLRLDTTNDPLTGFVVTTPAAATEFDIK